MERSCVLYESECIHSGRKHQRTTKQIDVDSSHQKRFGFSAATLNDCPGLLTVFDAFRVNSAMPTHLDDQKTS